MGMGKDLLKSIQGINNDTNLKTNEALALLRLVEYYNIDCGYAYPKYDDLKVAMKTKRSDTVSAALKGLVSKGYITIEKTSGNKNKYFIHTHLHFINTVEVVTPVPVVAASPNEEVVVPVEEVLTPVVATAKPVDSTGKKPHPDQIHIDEVLNKKIIEISDYTGFNKSQTHELLKDSKGDKNRVIISFEYAKKMKQSSNPQEIFAYTKWAVNNHKKVIECTTPATTVKERSFHNFEARVYDYDNLEKKLLGWDDGELSDSPNDYIISNYTAAL